MAAKKRSKKEKPKKLSARAKRGNGSVERSQRRVARGPRSQALPGMEQVRAVALDHACESISECREQLNNLRAEESGIMQTTLTTMKKLDVMTYRHAGVELIRVPGEERLRVRTSKAQATAETEPDEDVEAADEARDEAEA
jgi:hypothetical protein